MRNEPFTKKGRDVYVAVTGNEVRGYQKTGIVVNGSVLTLVDNNTVQGLGQVPYIAQNGVQVGFGGAGLVSRNTDQGQLLHRHRGRAGLRPAALSGRPRDAAGQHVHRQPAQRLQGQLGGSLLGLEVLGEGRPHAGKPVPHGWFHDDPVGADQVPAMGSSTRPAWSTSALT